MPTNQTSKQPKTVGDRLIALEKRVAALEGGNSSVLPPHGSIARLRELIVDDTKVVAVRDLVSAEIARTVEAITDEEVFAPGGGYSDAHLNERTNLYLTATETVAQMFVEAGYWGRIARDNVWPRSLQRLANASDKRNGLTVWLDLRLLPALITEFAGGIASIANDNYDSLAALFLRPQIVELSETRPAVLALYPSEVLDVEAARRLTGFERRLTPMSDWLHGVLRPWLEPATPDDLTYDDAFDRFEYLLGLSHMHLRQGRWAPLGRFAWKDRHRVMNRMIEVMVREFDEEGAAWGPFSAGLIGKSLDDAREVLRNYNDYIVRASAGWS